jgi:hypothetical protein
MTVLGYKVNERQNQIDEHMNQYASSGWRLHSTQLRYQMSGGDRDYIEHYFFWETD